MRRMPQSRHYARGEGISLRLRRRPHDLVIVLLAAISCLCRCAGLTYGLSGTATATATAGLDTVFLEISEVSVAGSWEPVHSAAAIVLRSLVLIANNHANWCTQSHSKFRSRLNFHAVLFVSRGRECALARTSPSHLRLDVILCEFHAGWAAVDNASDGAAVGFTIANERLEVWTSSSLSRRGNIRGDPEVVSPCRHGGCR